jgi:integrase
MAKFKARWPRGTRERVMFDILTYTGLRIGDVSVLGRQHVRNGVIRIDNEKTGMRVTIPMLAPLKATLDARPTGDLAFIVSRRGTPFNKGALGAAFVEAARAGRRPRQIGPRHPQGGSDAGSGERSNRA